MQYRGRIYTNKYYIQLFKHCATSQANMYTHGTQAVVAEPFSNINMQYTAHN
jgi:hypothetical protein